jgi:hypothetical protein
VLLLLKGVEFREPKLPLFLATNEGSYGGIRKLEVVLGPCWRFFFTKPYSFDLE